ncbi:MAG: hypothetical protein DJ555_02940 [Desulfurococcaceae archaeon]|jgi:amidophosphoribosyltransferase|nr:MAG: hypothetical protein DJ555_02940 [Desulfurococcaceae archaeon]
MTGILSIFSFEPGWELHHFVNYGLEALSHRGGSYKLACWWQSGRVFCEGFEYMGAENLREAGAAVAALLDREHISRQVIELQNSVTIFDRPSSLTSEIAEAVDKAMLSSQPHVELAKSLSLYREADAPSFTTLTSRGELVVWRSSLGLTPMTIGGYGFDLVIASSETSAIEVLDADIRRHLSPGEGVYLSRRQVRLFRSRTSNNCKLCLFELLYTARHDSVVDGVNVYEFRKSLGIRLGKYLDSTVDVVTGVPETAIPYAIGLSQAVGIPFEPGFVGTARRDRSMLKEGIRERLITVHLKLNPIRKVFRGKRVAIVDDSMVTGSTLKTVTQILRYRVGAKELHVLLASPRLVSTCPYNVTKLNPDIMVSAHLSDSQIVKYLDVDSLSWLREEDIEAVARSVNMRFCGICFGKDSLGGDQ